MSVYRQAITPAAEAPPWRTTARNPDPAVAGRAETETKTPAEISERDYYFQEKMHAERQAFAAAKAAEPPAAVASRPPPQRPAGARHGVMAELRRISPCGSRQISVATEARCAALGWSLEHLGVTVRRHLTHPLVDLLPRPHHPQHATPRLSSPSVETRLTRPRCSDRHHDPRAGPLAARRRDDLRHQRRAARAEGAFPSLWETSSASHPSQTVCQVVCFRGQSLSEDDQMAFGKHWGPLEVFPFAVAEGSDGQGKADPKIHRFHVNRNGPPPTPNLGAGGSPQSPEERTEEEQMATLQRMGGKTVASGWHSDVTWRKTPSLGSMLYPPHHHHHTLNPERPPPPPPPPPNPPFQRLRLCAIDTYPRLVGGTQVLRRCAALRRRHGLLRLLRSLAGAGRRGAGSAARPLLHARLR